jgi:predicted nucleotidyltransferase
VPNVHRTSPSERPAVLERLTKALADHPNVEFAYAYGSFLEDAGFRDIDVAIWTTMPAAARIDLELGIALTRVAGYPVDLRIINQAPVSFLFHVLRGQQLVVRNERHLADLIESTARTYHDRAPLTRRAVREAFGG